MLAVDDDETAERCCGCGWICGSEGRLKSTARTAGVLQMGKRRA